MPQVQITLSEEAHKAILHIKADTGVTVRAFIVEAVEAELRRRQEAAARALADPPRD